MKKFLVFMAVHSILALAITGYTWQNSMNLKSTDLRGVLLVGLKFTPIVILCNAIFLVVYFCGVKYWGLTFWQVQLAYWATAYVGLILFWKWNNFVPTTIEWVGIGFSLFGSLIPIIWPVIKNTFETGT